MSHITWTTDVESGSHTAVGPARLSPSNHSGMPPRGPEYEANHERGHLWASSLGGSNDPENIVPMDRDVNHRGYANMERAERNVLSMGGQVYSEKTAVCSQPNSPPEAFLVNSTVTYPDGNVQDVHLSFSNLSYAEQAQFNEVSASLPGTFDAPNPGDGLRDSMSPEAYSDLMENTDADPPAFRENTNRQRSAAPLPGTQILIPPARRLRMKV